MTTYSERNFNAQRYDMARPSYSDEFYTTLMSYHEQGKGNKDLAIDIGCGSGFVTFKLTRFFDKVIGTDISQTMIDKCQSESAKYNNVEFLIGSGEQFPYSIAENSVALITGAECCHWMDHSKFFKESYRVLQPGGTLAYWFYKDPIFVGFPKANEIYNKYCYDSDISEGWEKYMGPLWQQPGRNFLRTLMKEVTVPQELFQDIIRKEYHAGADENRSALYISRKITLNDLLVYVKSWSAYHTWMSKYGNDHQDVSERFVEDLKDQLGWNDDTVVEVVWDTMYTFARKISN